MSHVLPRAFVRPQLASAYGDPKRLTDATFERYCDLLLWGERDALIPFSNAADHLKALPAARLVSFPTLGHVRLASAVQNTAWSPRSGKAAPASAAR